MIRTAPKEWQIWMNASDPAIQYHGIRVILYFQLIDLIFLSFLFIARGNMVITTVTNALDI